MAHSQYPLAWDSYKSSICNGFRALQQNAEFVDMTLAADGHLVKVHQVLMALASPYLKDMIASAPCQHPVIFLNNMSHKVLSYLLEYIYTGEVVVPCDALNAFGEATRALHVKGLENILCDERPVTRKPQTTRTSTTTDLRMPIVENEYSTSSKSKVSFEPDHFNQANLPSQVEEYTGVEQLDFADKSQDYKDFLPMNDSAADIEEIITNNRIYIKRKHDDEPKTLIEQNKLKPMNDSAADMKEIITNNPVHIMRKHNDVPKTLIDQKKLRLMNDSAADIEEIITNNRIFIKMKHDDEPKTLIEQNKLKPMNDSAADMKEIITNNPVHIMRKHNDVPKTLIDQKKLRLMNDLVADINEIITNNPVHIMRKHDDVPKTLIDQKKHKLMNDSAADMNEIITNNPVYIMRKHDDVPKTLIYQKKLKLMNDSAADINEIITNNPVYIMRKHDDVPKTLIDQKKLKLIYDSAADMKEIITNNPVYIMRKHDDVPKTLIDQKKHKLMNDSAADMNEIITNNPVHIMRKHDDVPKTLIDQKKFKLMNDSAADMNEIITNNPVHIMRKHDDVPKTLIDQKKHKLMNDSAADMKEIITNNPVYDKKNPVIKLKGNVPQYSTTERGLLQLILNGYVYNCHHTSQRGQKRRFRCIEYRRHSCRAMVDTFGEAIVARERVLPLAGNSRKQALVYYRNLGPFPRPRFNYQADIPKAKSPEIARENLWYYYRIDTHNHPHHDLKINKKMKGVIYHTIKDAIDIINSKRIIKKRNKKTISPPGECNNDN